MKSNFTNAIFWIFIIILINTTQGQKSQLEQVFEELNMVHRVFKALALQNSAPRPREMIMELLNIGPTELEDLDRFDTDKVLQVIRKFSNVQKIDFGGVEGSEVGITKVFEDLGKAKMAQWVLGEDMDDVVKFQSRNLEIEGFLPCRKVPKRKTNLTQTINGAIDCLQKLQAFQSPDPPTSTLLKSLDALNSLWYYKELVKQRNETNMLLGNLHQVVRNLQVEYFNLSVYWNSTLSLPRGNNNENGTLSRILKSAVNRKTLGFRHNTTDMARVLDDVKSEWFQTWVSRGKNIDALIAGLAPIAERGRALEQLEITWNRVDLDLEVGNGNGSGRNSSVIAILERVGRSLQNIESFEKDPINKTVLDTSEAILDTCRNIGNLTSSSTSNSRTPNPSLNISDNFDTSFEAAYHLPRHLSKELGIVNNTISRILVEIDIPMTISELRRMEREVLTNGAIDGRIVEHESFKKAKPVFEAIWALQEAEERAMSTFRILNGSGAAVPARPFKEVQTIVNSTSILQMADCFKNFDHQKVIRLIAYVQNVYTIFNYQNLTIRYLESLAKFQEEFHIQIQKNETLGDPIRRFNDSLAIAHHFAAGMEVLQQMIRVQKENKTLQGPITYHADVLAEIRRLDDKPFWQDPGSSIRPLLAGINQLEMAAAGARLGEKLMDLRNVLLAAEMVPGIQDFKDRIVPLPDQLRPRSSQPMFQTAIENLEKLSDWDLDFVKHKKTLNSAYLSLALVSGYFDSIFGFNRSNSQMQITIIKPYLSYFIMTGMSLGFILLLAIIGCIVYGSTKNGKSRFRNIYLYYVPDKKEFERRWRYSLFMDCVDGNNALLDACHEGNSMRTRDIVRDGAYINVYDSQGNTALHIATKHGYSEIVELLIKNGADREAKNPLNQTPEQMIPAKNLQGVSAAKFEEFGKIEAIYAKCKDKKYRIRVPREFPSHLFRIYIEPKTDEKLRMEFEERFRGITFTEPPPNPTHCVVKTNADGHLETNDVNLLMWIFNGLIIVKESWMKECLENPIVIYEDSKYLVENVKYKGVVYKNCVLPWSQAMAKGTMPYLYGVYFVFCIAGYQSIETIENLVTTHGGQLHTIDSVPYNKEGMNPYIYDHLQLGPIFLLHDRTRDLTVYERGPDEFTLFTEREFMVFLLKRKAHKDSSGSLVPSVPDERISERK